jgi:hypothetical protein
MIADQSRRVSDQAWLRRMLKLYVPAQKNNPKPKWQMLIESSGGAALITVLLGGIVGGLITARYQSKEAELQRTRSKQDRVEQLRLDASKSAFDLVFATIAAAEDVINLSSQQMLVAPKAQRDGIRAAYNVADINWRTRSAVVGVTMAYYTMDYRGTTAAWMTVRNDVTKYFDCAGDWVGRHPFYSDGLQAGCIDERKKADESIDALQNQVFGPKQ